MLILILIILIIVAVLQIVKKNRHLINIIILSFIILITQFLMVNDSYQHYGTEIKKIKQVKKIHSLISTQRGGIILKKIIGKDKERHYVLIYRKNNKKRAYLYSENNYVKINKSNSASSPIIIIYENKRRYKNEISKLIFTGITDENQFISRKTIVEIPSNWFLGTSKELNKMQK